MLTTSEPAARLQKKKKKKLTDEIIRICAAWEMLINLRYKLRKKFVQVTIGFTHSKGSYMLSTDELQKER